MTDPSVNVPLQACDSETGASLVLAQSIRIQVLDCRSGAPIVGVTPAEVLLAPAGEDFDPAAHSVIASSEGGGWDIVANYQIPVDESSGNPSPASGFTPPSDLEKLQIAMNALGYDCGRPSSSFGNQGYSALRAYQTDWYAAHPEEPQPAEFTRAVTSAWVRRIVADYNERFIRAVQRQLTLLGYDCESDDGAWGETTKAQFTAWQRDSLGYRNPFHHFNGAQASRVAVAKTLEDAFSATDANGIFRLPVPQARILDGFKIRIRFADFAIVNEHAAWRTAGVSGPTDLSVEWVGPQTTIDWGWRVRGPAEPANTSDASLPEFKTQLEYEVPAACSGVLDDLSDAEREQAGFSPLFCPGEGAPEIVVFALLWCQPVWDEYLDPATASINTHASVQDPAERGRRMHIVTTYFDLSGSAEFGGKGYGLYETGGLYRGHGHRGLDLHAVLGANAFAVHAGTISFRATDGDGGNVANLNWTGTGRTNIGYLHLDSFVGTSGSRVRAGQIIGRAGRSGNLGAVSRWPGHVHVNVGAGVALRSSPDAANRVCIPCNESPLLFPCACAITQAAHDPSTCQFGSSTFATPCWAVSELRCPHMNLATQADRKLQAQLKFLWRNNNRDAGPYVDPGSFDGDLGAVPQTPTQAASAGRSRRAIRAFRVAHELTPADAAPPAGYTMDAAAQAVLDQLAPITAAGA